MNKILKCPGKVFLFGEYACLAGAPALVMTIDPQYELKIEKSERFSYEGILPASPAGVFLIQNKADFEGLTLKFHDPYDVAMGTGSSSAQFLLCYELWAEIKGIAVVNPHDILKAYWKIIGDSQGLRPSGVDICAQWMRKPSKVIVGEVGVKCTPLDIAKDFPFHLYLGFTGTKIKTHEHLKILKARHFPEAFKELISDLAEIIDKAEKTLANGSVEFVTLIREYQEALNEAHIGSHQFQNYIDEVHAMEGILSVKGSGAQDGDCVLVCTEKTTNLEVSERLQYLRKLF